MRKWQITIALTIAIIIIGGANIFFWNTTYTVNGENNYALGYQQGKTDEHQTAYQEGYTQGNTTGYQTGYTHGEQDGYSNGNQTGYLEGKNQGIIIGNNTGYTQGYSNGHTQGYETGKNEGYTEGNITGYNLGHTVGYQAGQTTGYTQGNNAGYQTGYSEGYSKGDAAGYLQGVKDGAGTGYNIRDPTYTEMLAFIAADQTDQNTYNADTYNCYDFTRDVCNNAFNAGYRAGDVYIEFPNSAHAIVCFNTVDRGLIFIEPQLDDIVTLTIGEYYSDSNGFIPTTWDDTIVRYGIIW